MVAKENLKDIPDQTKGRKPKTGPKVFYFNFKVGEIGYEKLVTAEKGSKRPKDVVAYLLDKYL